MTMEHVERSTSRATVRIELTDFARATLRLAGSEDELRGLARHELLNMEQPEENSAAERFIVHVFKYHDQTFSLKPVNHPELDETVIELDLTQYVTVELNFPEGHPFHGKKVQVPVEMAGLMQGAELGPPLEIDDDD